LKCRLYDDDDEMVNFFAVFYFQRERTVVAMRR
jgi:hypothetical protein